uniref:Uncharacterized protein n=1 Tax=Anopheles christyi TaxID=43041 RepID=A0A182KI02_9DIPT
MKQFDIVTLVGGIQPQRYLIDTQEYLHRPGPITATPAVDNIFRPGTALDADSRFRFRSCKMYRYEWAQVAVNVHVWVVVCWETLARQVFDRSELVFVTVGELLTCHPHLSTVCDGKRTNVRCQIVRHVGGQLIDIFVKLGLPAVNSV